MIRNCFLTVVLGCLLVAMSRAEEFTGKIQKVNTSTKVMVVKIGDKDRPFAIPVKVTVEDAFGKTVVYRRDVDDDWKTLRDILEKKPSVRLVISGKEKVEGQESEAKKLKNSDVKKPDVKMTVVLD